MFRTLLKSFPKSSLSAPIAAGGAVGFANFFYEKKVVKCNGKSTEEFAPFVLVGPSGVGKGTLIKKMTAEFPNAFGFSVSTTTRKPRPGEVDGKDYHFVDSDHMHQQIEAGKFIEYAKVHTNMYGTSAAALEAVESQKKIAILDIDVQGAKQVKEKLAGAHFIFLAPPSMEVLEGRLRGRGTENEHKIQVRLQNARGEIEFSKTPGFFDIVLVADDGFELALPKLRQLLVELYPQLVRA